MAVGVEGIREAVLNFALTELSTSTTNHIYTYMKSGIGSSRHHILTSLLAAKDSTENSLEEVVARRQKPGAIYETLVTCRDADFKMHFRMTRSTIQV